jgi:predicted acetyltransferase
MTKDPRVLAPAEWDRWYEAFELAFGGVAGPAEDRELMRELTGYERSIGVWDGEECVGTAGAYSFRVTVPGGAQVPAAGVMAVSVAPTHRRRGVLTSMMRRQLDDIRSWGEPLALLTASEPAIYGRFGYGEATRQLSARIDTSRVRLAMPAGTDGVRLRRAKPDDPAVRDACEAVHSAEITTRPGMLTRAPGWARMAVLDPAESRGGKSPLQCVLATRDGELVGFTRYRVAPEWDSSGPRGTVELKDLHALDPVAYASLWRYLFDIDLTSTLSAANRPSDDPFQHLASDIRRCGLGMRDSMYARLVDVSTALQARTYRAPVDVVLEVDDAFCPWNEGRWRLTGGPSGAACERTADSADLALSVRELGAAYLGGVSLLSLGGAGRVREQRQGALAEASAALTSDVAPWLPHGF